MGEWHSLYGRMPFSVWSNAIFCMVEWNPLYGRMQFAPTVFFLIPFWLLSTNHYTGFPFLIDWILTSP